MTEHYKKPDTNINDDIEISISSDKIEISHTSGDVEPYIFVVEDWLFSHFKKIGERIIDEYIEKYLHYDIRANIFKYFNNYDLCVLVFKDLYYDYNMKKKDMAIPSLPIINIDHFDLREYINFIDIINTSNSWDFFTLTFELINLDRKKNNLPPFTDMYANYSFEYRDICGWCDAISEWVIDMMKILSYVLIYRTYK